MLRLLVTPLLRLARIPGVSPALEFLFHLDAILAVLVLGYLAVRRRLKASPLFTALLCAKLLVYAASRLSGVVNDHHLFAPQTTWYLFFFSGWIGSALDVTLWLIVIIKPALFWPKPVQPKPDSAG